MLFLEGKIKDKQSLEKKYKQAIEVKKSSVKKAEAAKSSKFPDV